jgi:hypothetical protein
MEKNNIICKICKKKFKTLKGFSKHLSCIHKINLKKYYDEYCKNEYEGICKNPKCDKETTFVNKLFGYRDFCYNCSRSNNIEVLKIKYPDT